MELPCSALYFSQAPPTFDGTTSQAHLLAMRSLIVNGKTPLHLGHVIIKEEFNDYLLVFFSIPSIVTKSLMETKIE